MEFDTNMATPACVHAHLSESSFLGASQISSDHSVNNRWDVKSMHLIQLGTKMTKIKLTVLTSLTAGELLALSGCIKAFKYKDYIVKFVCHFEENTMTYSVITKSEISLPSKITSFHI